MCRLFGVCGPVSCERRRLSCSTQLPRHVLPYCLFQLLDPFALQLKVPYGLTDYDFPSTQGLPVNSIGMAAKHGTTRMQCLRESGE